MLNNRKLLLAIGALIFFTILFCLPGSAFPKEDWFSKIWFDKWVHIGIFLVLLFVWFRALQIKSLQAYILIVIIALAYGFTIEIIQDRFIPNRSFDMGDLIADAIGSVVGILLWDRYKKNKPL
jgi:VanZ family protein